MQLLFASTNPHKIEEVRVILQPIGIEVRSLDDFHVVPDEPVEDGNTFEANARIKAVYYAKHLGCNCLADDSGLEVDALDGAPGVHSARYASDEVADFFALPRSERDAANNRKLLCKLETVSPENRTARFVCAMCISNAVGTIIAETRGTFDGILTDSPAGDNGFGYDPLLYVPDAQCTSAQLSPRDKNARSHRGVAARRIAALLRDNSPAVND